MGEPCFAEVARRAAQRADVVVVNTHLYGLHVASGEALLPDHDVVVIDEAHQLEDVISATAGLSIGAGRFAALARIGPLESWPTRRRPPPRAGAGDELVATPSTPFAGRRLPEPLPGEVVDALVVARAASTTC